MRIHLVCGDPGVPPDGTKGASVHLRSLAAALTRQGHEVVLFAVRPAADPGQLPVPLLPLAGAPSLLAAAAASGPPDVVYERYALGHTAGLAAARTLHRPLVLEVNAPLVLEAARHRPGTVAPAHAVAEEHLFGQADLVVAVSEPLRRFVARRRGRDEGTAVVPNGCEPALFPRPAPLDGREGRTLVFLGHPKPWHGAETLADVVADLAGRGHDPRLLLVGGGAGADAVATAARRRGVQGRVDVTGPLPPAEAAARLAGGLVAVAPYPRQPFFYFCPLKVVECMAAGLPVVTTAQGDLDRIVGDGGVLVTPGDSAALSSAVEGLLVDEPLRRELGRQARRRALGCFTWDGAAATITDLVGARLGVAA